MLTYKETHIALFKTIAVVMACLFCAGPAISADTLAPSVGNHAVYQKMCDAMDKKLTAHSGPGNGSIKHKVDVVKIQSVNKRLRYLSDETESRNLENNIGRHQNELDRIREYFGGYSQFILALFNPGGFVDSHKSEGEFLANLSGYLSRLLSDYEILGDIPVCDYPRMRARVEKLMELTAIAAGGNAIQSVLSDPELYKIIRRDNLGGIAEEYGVEMTFLHYLNMRYSGCTVLGSNAGLRYVRAGKYEFMEGAIADDLMFFARQVFFGESPYVYSTEKEKLYYYGKEVSFRFSYFGPQERLDRDRNISSRHWYFKIGSESGNMAADRSYLTINFHNFCANKCPFCLRTYGEKETCFGTEAVSAENITVDEGLKEIEIANGADIFTKVEKISVVEGGFHSEEEELSYLEELITKLRQRGFKGKISTFTAFIKNAGAFEKLKAIGCSMESCSYPMEAFTNRDRILGGLKVSTFEEALSAMITAKKFYDNVRAFLLIGLADNLADLDDYLRVMAENGLNVQLGTYFVNLPRQFELLCNDVRKDERSNGHLKFYLDAALIARRYGYTRPEAGRQNGIWEAPADKYIHADGLMGLRLDPESLYARAEELRLGQAAQFLNGLRESSRPLNVRINSEIARQALSLARKINIYNKHDDSSVKPAYAIDVVLRWLDNYMRLCGVKATMERISRDEVEIGDLFTCSDYHIHSSCSLPVKRLSADKLVERLYNLKRISILEVKKRCLKGMYDRARLPQDMERLNRLAVDIAYKFNNLRDIAITDHENLEGIEPFAAALSVYNEEYSVPQEERLKFIPGIEVEVAVDDMPWLTMCHFNAYFAQIDPSDKRALAELNRRLNPAGEFGMDDARKGILLFTEKFVSAVNAFLNEEVITMNDLMRYSETRFDSEDSVRDNRVIRSRWHYVPDRDVIIHALIKKFGSARIEGNRVLIEDYIESLRAAEAVERHAELQVMPDDEVFTMINNLEKIRREVKNSLTGRDYLKYGPGAAQMCSLLRRAGATNISLNHPVRVMEEMRAHLKEAPEDELKKKLEAIISKSGVTAMEVVYPGQDGGIGFYHDLADRHGLVISGGSDFHGKSIRLEDEPGFAIDGFFVPSMPRIKSAVPADSAITTVLPSEWIKNDFNGYGFIRELSELLQADNMFEQDKSTFIFSEKATFDNGLGILLPKMAKSGIRVAVVASSDRQRALIDELNKGKPDDERIVYAGTIAEIRTKVHSARYYYFKVNGDPDTDLHGVITFDITQIVKKIIDALGRACGIVEREKLELLHEAARRFAQSA